METECKLTKIKPEINLDNLSDDYQKIEEYFSYIIDCIAEIQTCIHLCYNVGDFFLKEDNHKSIYKRVLFNNIILNICRISEIQKTFQLLNKYYPTYKKKVDEIINRYYGKATDYRNHYLAHPKNKNQEIKTPKERLNIITSIIGDEGVFISDMQELCNIYFAIFHGLQK